MEILLYHGAADWVIEVSVLLESLESEFTVDFVQFPISMTHVNPIVQNAINQCQK